MSKSYTYAPTRININLVWGFFINADSMAIYVIFLFCEFNVWARIKNMLCKENALLSKHTSTLAITYTYVPNTWDHQKLSSFQCIRECYFGELAD